MKRLKQPLTITVANGKGGVGKSTIIRFLSYNLALKGYKTLVVDEDPQSNTTKTMLITKENHEEKEHYQINKTLMAGVRDGDLKPLITPIIDNLDMIPSHMDFKNLPTFLAKKYGIAESIDKNYHQIELKKVSFMRDLLEPIKQDYDFILIDTPPTTSVYTRSAVYASDYVILAFQTQSDSYDGALQFLENDMSDLIENFDADTDIIGVLPNQFTYHGAIDETVLADAVEKFGQQNIFEHIIPFAKRIQSAPRLGIRKDTYWDKKLFKDVIDPLTEDFLNRVEKVGGFEDE
ncbi:ParA family protein [Holzapfeliella sp. He02]|uniref:ParA family protein n=1 Tax=Holzapfeliella saturejae TaxID=3082953 RepID=A0ABU8SHX8_9LACO